MEVQTTANNLVADCCQNYIHTCIHFHFPPPQDKLSLSFSCGTHVSLEFQETKMCGNATCEIRITSGYVLFDSSMAQSLASQQCLD